MKNKLALIPGILVLLMSVSFQSCKKNERQTDLPDKYNDLSTDISKVARWYDKETSNTKAHKLTSENIIDWHKTVKVEMIDGQFLYAVPLSKSDSVSVEVNINTLADKSYFGIIKEYKWSKTSDVLTLKLSTLNGDLIEEGYLNENNKYITITPVRLNKKLMGKPDPRNKKKSEGGEDPEGSPIGVTGGGEPIVVITAPGGSPFPIFIPFIPTSMPGPERPTDQGGNAGAGPGQNPDSKDPKPESLTGSELSEAVPIEDGKDQIKEIKKYIDCFNDGKEAKSFTMTIYVDQPIAGKTDSYSYEPKAWVSSNNPYGVPTGIHFELASSRVLNVGHTFVCFEKNNVDGTNVRQTVGFYPGGKKTSSKGVIKDDSGHPYDVSYTINVSANQFNQSLEALRTDADNSIYKLSRGVTNPEYNCSDAGLCWMNKAGAELKGNFSANSLFDATPGGLGQSLREKPNANKNGGTAPKGKGPC